MSDIQKYSMNLYAPVMEEDHNGNYVKYDDHMAICIEQEKELMKAEEEIALLRQHLKDIQEKAKNTDASSPVQLLELWGLINAVLEKNCEP